MRLPTSVTNAGSARQKGRCAICKARERIGRATSSPISRASMSPSRARAPNMTAARKFARSNRSEEHTSELQSLMRHSNAVFCLKKKNKKRKDEKTYDIKKKNSKHSHNKRIHTNTK